MIVMEIPNLRQGREKTVKMSVAIFQKYILYWSRLFYFDSDVGFYGVVEKLYLGMPVINTVIFNGCILSNKIRSLKLCIHITYVINILMYNIHNITNL